MNYFDGDELAQNVFDSKYAKNGETPDQMHMGMAKCFADIQASHTWTKKPGLSNYGKDRKNLDANDIYELFRDFRYVVPQGSVMATLRTDVLASLSNCYVLPEPHDSYGGILMIDQEMAQLYKRRGGVGTGISSLRPNGTSTKNTAGTSTGATSFMERYSNTTREVAMSGRRGALMLTIDCRHPDVLEFINIKKDRTKVTGANISVHLREDFMLAVESDDDYIQRFPIDMELPVVDLEYGILTAVENGWLRRVRATDIYNSIIENAHDNAEPGQIFLDRVIDYCPDGVYDAYRPRNPNPCAEEFLQPYDSCRLMLLNLYSFVVNPFNIGYIDWEQLYRISYEMMVLGDDLVDLEVQHIDKIIEKITLDPEPDVVKRVEIDLWHKIRATAISARRFGGGITALGDMLAALSLPYDSENAAATIKMVMRTIMRAELDATIDLAIQRGTFDGYNSAKEFEIVRLTLGVNPGLNSFYRMLWDEFEPQCRRMMVHGRRNVSWNTISPAGSVSCLTQTTSGCEPLFQPYYIRRKKINAQEVRVDFVDDLGDKWQEFAVIHPKFKKYLEIYGLDENPATIQQYFEDSPWFGSTANDINWQKRVELQSILQRYTTNAISSTINLPNDVAKSEVAAIYMAAWKSGCKGLTVYRDGCRSGVLITNTEQQGFEEKDAVKRPQTLKAMLHKVKIKGIQWFVYIGLLEGKPYEVFSTDKNFIVGENLSIRRRGKKAYDLYSEDNCTVTDFAKAMNHEHQVLTRMISTSLRHGVNVKYIVEQLHKAGEDIHSPSQAIARVLKKYIPEGDTSSEQCEECGVKLIFEEGCQKCPSCGNSKC